TTKIAEGDAGDFWSPHPFPSLSLSTLPFFPKFPRSFLLCYAERLMKRSKLEQLRDPSPGVTCLVAI
ncbi:hypothetical protein U1Q18_048411, partial [Sarracenia purpurea var. burkii]